MSNALSSLVGLLAEQQQLTPVGERFLMGILSAGVMVLLIGAGVFAARRATRRAGEPQLLGPCPGRCNTLSVLHPIAIFLFWHTVAAAVMVGLFRAMTGEMPQPLPPGELIPPERLKAVLAGTASGQILGIAFALFLLRGAFRHGLARGLGLSGRHWLWDTVRAVVSVLAVLPVCIGLLLLTSWLMPADWIQEHVMFRALEQLGVQWKVLVIVSSIALAAILEEILFRGVLQSLLRHYVGPWPAVLVSSGLFALAHFSQPQSLPSLFVLAVVLGLAYERSGRLWTPIVTHALFNAVFITSELL